MKKSHVDKLVAITGRLEDIIMSSENISRSEMDNRISAVYRAMTETVGAILLEQDEMSGNIE